MAYNSFQPTKPDPSTDAGTAFGNNTNRNDLALRDALIMGQMPGWTFRVTVGGGSQAQPQYFVFENGAGVVVRATNTWGNGVTDGNITGQLWEYSSDWGANYATIVTHGTTWDGAGVLLTTTGSAGMQHWLMAKFAPLKKVIADLATHVAGQGTGVHGLGNMSMQTAGNVAIAGGAINSTAIGGTTPAAGTFTRAVEQFNTYTPGASAAQALDWAKGGSSVTTNGTNTLSFSNVPANVIATHTLFVDKANGVNYPASVNWGQGGRPALGAVAAIVQLVSIDGGTNVRASYYWNA